MTIALLMLVLAALIYNAVVTTLRWMALAKNRDANEPVNVIPSPIQVPSEEEKAVIPFYQKEWTTIMETQMHFNDLIIRFRSIVLTAFITLVGASVALQKTERIDAKQVVQLLFLLFILWITAFVLDFFYYHRLLLGSVAQAMKFDRSELARRLGLFGLTTCISNVVPPLASKVMVALFYAIPAIGCAIVMAIFSWCWT